METWKLLLRRDRKVDYRDLVVFHVNVLLPAFGLRQYGSLHAPLSQNVEGTLPTNNVPPFVPGDDLIFAWWHVCEFKPATLVRHSIVRMRDYHQQPRLLDCTGGKALDRLNVTLGGKVSVSKITKVVRLWS